MSIDTPNIKNVSKIMTSPKALSFSPFEVSLLIHCMYQSRKHVPEGCAEDCNFIMELLSLTHDENCALWDDNSAWTEVSKAAREYLKEVS